MTRREVLNYFDESGMLVRSSGVFDGQQVGPDHPVSDGDVVELAEGDVVKVKVLEVDRQGRVRLSMKEVEAA